MSESVYWFAPRPPNIAHRHPFLVFDSRHRLHFHLTVFAGEATTHVAGSTLRSYLYAILPFFTFLDQDPWQVRAGIQWDSAAPDVRRAIIDYLTQHFHCKISVHHDEYHLIRLTSGTDSSIRAFLSGLKLFYTIMRRLGYYSSINPLVDHLATTRRDVEQIVQQHGKPPTMPSKSGTSSSKVPVRLTDSYFKLERDEWTPHIVDDPNLPTMILEAGRRVGWSLREICVTRLLFESGARISEVVGLQLGDWVLRNALREADSFSKGSHGRRVKVLRFSDETAKLLRHYVNTERRKFDPHGYNLAHYLQFQRNRSHDELQTPLFLTIRRTPLSASNFRDQFWNRACRHLGLRVNVHQTRHWYVTRMVRHIYETAKDEGDVQRGLHALIQYMQWNSGWETLQAYEHYFDTSRLAEIQDELHMRMYQHVVDNDDPRQPQKIRETRIPESLLRDNGAEDDPEFAFLRMIGGGSNGSNKT